MPSPSPSPAAGESALIVGAGIEQVPVIRLAHGMGIAVTAVDGNPDAPGLALADRGEAIDLRRVEDIVALARAQGCRCVLPAPIGAFLTTVGAVNEALGLRGISLDAARRCVDKALFDATLRAAGIPVAETRHAEAPEEILRAAAGMGFPLVLKPSRGSGSRGLLVASDQAELEHELAWHLAARAALPVPQESLVQRFIPGHEVGVDAMMSAAHYCPLAIRDKELTPPPFRLGYAYLAPTTLAPEAQVAVNAAVGAAAHALGLSDCLLHADVILDPDGQPWVIELAGRPSGFHIATRMLPRLLGYDPLRAMILHSLEIDEPEPPRGAPVAVILRMLRAEPGTLVAAVEGIEAAASLPGVVACETHLCPGDLIDEWRDGRSGFRAGYLMTAAPTRDDAERLWQDAARMIRFISPPTQ